MEKRDASKKDTVWGESSEFCVCGKFNYCEWVGRNSLTLARMIIHASHSMTTLGTMNNTTVMVATVMNSNYISYEMQQQQQQSKQIATKPFLRKGTRKEPSALHTFATTATAIITSVGNIGLTPSSFRCQQ